MVEPEVKGDPQFDKKLLSLLFAVTLLCLIGISVFPVPNQTAQITLVTTLSGTLSGLMGGIITLTSGRSSQRTTDSKGGTVTTTETDSDK